MATNDMPLKKRLFYIGNIIPDLTFSFLLRLHTYTSCGTRVKKLLRRLVGGDIAKGSVLFSFYTGIISHYVCDFLCFAHMVAFKGNVREHCRYEKKQVVRVDDMLPFSRQGFMSRSYSELLIGIEECVVKREQMLSKNICISSLDIPLAIYAAIWVTSAVYLHAEQVGELEAVEPQLVSA